MKIPIYKFVMNWQTGHGVQWATDNEGTIVIEHYNPDGGIRVDWINAQWLEKEGLLDDKYTLQHKEDKHVYAFFKSF